MRKILVCESNHILITGVVKLLTNVSCLQVVSISILDKEQILETLHRYNPDVIVCDDQIEAEYLIQLLRPFQVGPDFRVIILNQENNWVQVYDKQDLLVDNHTDLISAVTSIKFGSLEPNQEGV